MTALLGFAHGVVAGLKAKTRQHVKKPSVLEDDPKSLEYVDLEIEFLSGKNLPKMDVSGAADPFFVAKIDKQIRFVSTVQVKTREPEWNEVWRVKNVPTGAHLHVAILDKDDGMFDDYIGKIESEIVPGTHEIDIVGPVIKRERGTFTFKITSKPAENNEAWNNRYEFDGPLRYSRHCSPLIGKLTTQNDERLFFTWKLYLKSISQIMGDEKQHWNRDYKAAKDIFKGPSGLVIRTGIKTAHKVLYARSTTNGSGVVDNGHDLMDLFRQHSSDEGEAYRDRVKPAVYSYAISIDDDSWRFSETGAEFFADAVSKHALHSHCGEEVWYSGEFHPRPQGGWENFDDNTPDDQVKWELVIDNDSGTYSPDPKQLPKLKALMELNFPGLEVFALDHEDEELKKSSEACKEYAVKYRGVKRKEVRPKGEDQLKGPQERQEGVGVDQVEDTMEKKDGDGKEEGREESKQS